MYKKIFVFTLIILLFSGCKKDINEDVNTVIEENKNIIVGINYPTTGYKKIDNLINKDIEIIYNNFKDEYESFSNLTIELTSTLYCFEPFATIAYIFIPPANQSRRNFLFGASPRKRT